jgi:hypothetical protein
MQVVQIHGEDSMALGKARIGSGVRSVMIELDKIWK